MRYQLPRHLLRAVTVIISPVSAANPVVLKKVTPLYAPLGSVLAEIDASAFVTVMSKMSVTAIVLLPWRRTTPR